MITAVLGDRTLELAAETPYRQAAKEAFRHFGTSEGTVKIYAGGQHVKSFRGGGWKDAVSTNDIQEAGLTTESNPSGDTNSWNNKDTLIPLAEHNHWVRLWEGIVQPNNWSPDLHRYTMFMMLPDSTDILVVRDRTTTVDNRGGKGGPRYKHKIVRYQEVVFDLESSPPTFTIARKGDTFKISDDTPQPYPALHDILNKIFRHKNLQTEEAIVSLGTDEMTALESRLKDNKNILPKICAPFLEQRYTWIPEKGLLTPHKSSTKGAPPAPLIITCPFVTIVSAKMVEAHENALVEVTVTEEGGRDKKQEVLVTTNNGTTDTVKAPIPEGLKPGDKFTFEHRTEIGFPWFSNMLGSRFQAAIKGRLRELPIERTDLVFKTGKEMKDKITLQYDHGNISLGWGENGKLFLRHNDLEVVSTQEQSDEFERTGKIPWVDQAFTRNWKVLLSERIDMAKELNIRHQLYTYNKECTQNVMYTGTLKPDGPYRESSEVKICGAKEENNAGSIWDAATQKNPDAEPTYTMLLPKYEQATKMNSHSIALAFGMK